MPDKAWIDLAQFAVNIVLAVVTISLFVQGQRDRRRVDSDRRKDQASRISLLRHELSERTRPAGGGFAESWSLRSTNVTVRNDSQLPITQVSVITAGRTAWAEHSDPYRPRQRVQHQYVQFPQLDSQPFGLSVLPGESLVYEGDPLPSQYLRLRFTDGAGVAWVKDTFDGKLWNASGRQPTWRSRITQGIFLTPRLKWLTWIIHTMPRKHADRRFRETKSGVPWSARWVRFTWGYVPMAEPDPWDMPSGAPPNEWTYDFWIDVTRRQNQRQRRGPCGIKVQVPNPYARKAASTVLGDDASNQSAPGFLTRNSSSMERPKAKRA